MVEKWLGKTPPVANHNNIYFCPVDVQGQKLLEMVTGRFGFSARTYARILKVARTIADLAGSEAIQHHLAEIALMESSAPGFFSPGVGDWKSRQIGVFTGSGMIFCQDLPSIATFCPHLFLRTRDMHLIVFEAWGNDTVFLPFPWLIPVR